jgi:hypothetical protein
MQKPTKEQRELERAEAAEQARYEAKMLAARAAYHRKFPVRDDLIERVARKFPRIMKRLGD